MKKMQRKPESGRSMVEMVGVLAVAGLLTVGAFVLIQNGMKSQKYSRTVDEVTTIATEMQNVDLHNLTQDVKEGRNILESLHLPTETPFGKESFYSVWVSGNGDSDDFVVSIANMDAEMCKAMTSAGWNDIKSVKCEDGNLNIVYTKKVHIPDVNESKEEPVALNVNVRRVANTLDRTTATERLERDVRLDRVEGLEKAEKRQVEEERKK